MKTQQTVATTHPQIWRGGGKLVTSSDIEKTNDEFKTFINMNESWLRGIGTRCCIAKVEESIRRHDDVGSISTAFDGVINNTLHVRLRSVAKDTVLGFKEIKCVYETNVLLRLAMTAGMVPGNRYGSIERPGSQICNSNDYIMAETGHTRDFVCNKCRITIEHALDVHVDTHKIFCDRTLPSIEEAIRAVGIVSASNYMWSDRYLESLSTFAPLRCLMRGVDLYLAVPPSGWRIGNSPEFVVGQTMIGAMEVYSSTMKESMPLEEYLINIGAMKPLPSSARRAACRAGPRAADPRAGPNGSSNE